MKTLILSLMFLMAFSFQGNMDNAQAATKTCTDCVSFADGAAHAGGDWVEAFYYCFGHLDPCGVLLDPVVVSGDLKK